jgi:hypothetical protein
MPLQLAFPSRMFKNRRELWIGIHDDDMRKREADAASCATNDSRVLRTHLRKAGRTLTSLPFLNRLDSSRFFCSNYLEIVVASPART